MFAGEGIRKFDPKRYMVRGVGGQTRGAPHLSERHRGADVERRLREKVYPVEPLRRGGCVETEILLVVLDLNRVSRKRDVRDDERRDLKIGRRSERDAQGAQPLGVG